MGDRYRDGGFTDAAGADDGHEPGRAKFGRDGADIIRPPNHARQPSGQESGVRRRGFGWRTQAGRIFRARDRGHEAVAAPGQCRDIARPIFAVAKRLAQAGDVKPQAALLHGDIWPDKRQ